MVKLADAIGAEVWDMIRPVSGTSSDSVQNA